MKTGGIYMKDQDSAARARALRAVIWVFYPFFFIGFTLCYFNYDLPFLVSILISSAIAAVIAGGISPIVMFIVNRTGDVAGRILTGQKAAWSVRERLQADFDKARHFTAKKNFQQALELVNAILEQDSDWSEALFLKARILSEGFGNTAGAKGYLEKILEKEADKNSTICRWASELYRKLSDKQL